jgi:TIR domain
MAKLFGAQRLILQAIDDATMDAAGFVTDAQVAGSTGIDQKDVRDWLQTLDEQEFIEVARLQDGFRAAVTPKGRLALGQYRPISPEGEAVTPRTAQPTVAVLVDESHGQFEWHERPTADIGFKEAIDALKGFCNIKVNKSNSFSQSLLDGIDVALIPTPLDAEFNEAECDAIARWVFEGHGLLLLGSYLMEAHHKINLNMLARRFGFGFESDLIMQAGTEDFQSCIQQAFGIDNRYTIITQPLVLQGNGDLLRGIKSLAFQSSCTIDPDTTDSLVIGTGEKCSKMKARGIRDNRGRFKHINDYYCDKKLNAPFFIAASSGRGRVVGIGCHKVFSNEMILKPDFDNKKLLENCVRWLSFLAGPVPVVSKEPEPESPTEVFYSYAHEDESLREELEKHLALLKRQGLISSWVDSALLPGQQWAEQISEHLESAGIILLLVSSSFLASDYCYGLEMQRALERHESGTARVIPVIVRPCDWHRAPFGKLQALPKNAKPVTSWANKDEAWSNVARGIRRAVEAITASKKDT